MQKGLASPSPTSSGSAVVVCRYLAHVFGPGSQAKLRRIELRLGDTNFLAAQKSNIQMLQERGALTSSETYPAISKVIQDVAHVVGHLSFRYL
jgi:hypothetical protein